MSPGTRHRGLPHWRAQRATALVLVPLTLWFLFSLLLLPDFGWSSIADWLSAPWSLAAMALLVFALAWHSHLGVQMVLEDYVHAPGILRASLLASLLAHVAVVGVALLALLRLVQAGLP